MNRDDQIQELIAICTQQIELQMDTNALLSQLLEAVNNSSMSSGGKKARASLSKEAQADVEDSMMSIEEWFQFFGEDPHPAKFSNQSGVAFMKNEADHCFNTLLEVASIKPEVNGGSHTFQYLGKKYCKAERNTVNCFACVPKKVN